MLPESKMSEEHMDCDTAPVGQKEEVCHSSTSNDGGLTEQLNQMVITPEIPVPPLDARVTTKEGKEYSLTQNVYSKSNVLSEIVFYADPDPDNLPMVLEHITSATMEKIIEFCEHDADLHNVDDECSCKLSDWHNNTFFWVNQDTLFKLIRAADFLSMPCLFKLATYTIARLIENKTVEDIRKIFGIKNDFTAYQYRMAEAEANNILQRQLKKP